MTEPPTYTDALALDRERIARELHDDAIQRLFATGLILRSAIEQPADERRPPMVEHHVNRAVDELDEAIRSIRAAIYGLQSPRVLLDGPTRAIRAAVAEAGRVLVEPPHLEMSGNLDDLPDDVALDVVGACRELISNVVRHARAARCWIAICLDAQGLTLTIEDDGVGCPTATIGGLGVGNVRARATTRGGRCSWNARRPSGTTVVWWVPASSTQTVPADHIAVPLPGFETPGFETEHAA